MMDTGIADRLRAAGVPVVEVSGWQSRSAGSFDPRGAVNHHTAGGSSGSTPSLNVCINGRPDVPGPLCNVMQSREPDGNDKAYVIAAGRANHAGSGGWNGMSGNSSVYGLEIEHTGVDPLPEHRQRRAAQIIAALYSGSTGNVCQHREWAPSRKIDAAEGVDANRFRQWVGEYQGGSSGPPPSTGEFDLSKEQYDSIMRELQQVESKIDSNGAGQNLIYEKSVEKMDWLLPKCVRSESNNLWIVTASGRWQLKDSGQFSRGAMLQWLQVLGLVSPGDPVEADNDYLHGVPRLDVPGETPST